MSHLLTIAQIHDLCVKVCERVECACGNCAVFAIALNRFLGGTDEDNVFAVVWNEMDTSWSTERYAHVALEYQGVFFDRCGALSQNSFLRWAECDVDTACDCIRQESSCLVPDGGPCPKRHLASKLTAEEALKGTAPQMRVEEMLVVIQRVWKKMRARR